MCMALIRRRGYDMRGGRQFEIIYQALKDEGSQGGVYVVWTSFMCKHSTSRSKLFMNKLADCIYEFQYILS